MKRNLLLIICFLVIIKGFTQERTGFIPKWAPGSLAAGKITVGGEYNFKPRKSIDFMVGIPVSITHNIDYDGTNSDMTFKGFSALLGYRYYTGKRTASGLYLEPYAKFVKQEATGVLEGRLMSQKALFDTRADYKGIGIGLQLGYQFLVRDRFAIDFYFAGPEGNYVEFNTLSKDISSNLPWTEQQAQEAERDIVELIEDVPIIGKKTTVHVDNNTKEVDVNFTGLLPSFRFGVSFGWRF